MALMEPRIVRTPVTAEDLHAAVTRGFQDMVKVVVDVRRGILALDGDLHADGEAGLLNDGSRQEDLWGANVYPAKPTAEQVEYTALINIRPRQGNRSMDIQDSRLREEVAAVIRKLLPLP